MPLFEIETDAHIIISWAADEQAASAVVHDAYPGEKIVRLTRRPRDSWVISKSALGINDSRSNPCGTRGRQGARDPALYARDGRRSRSGP